MAIQTTGISLEQALANADTANIDLITSRLSVATARANLRSARTSPNPTLSVNAVQVRPRLVGNLPYGQLVDTVVRIDMPFERGGKRRARVGQATASIAAAEGDLKDARRQMIAAVTDAYFGLKSAEQRLAVQRSIAAGYRTSGQVAARRQAAGSISKGDLAKQNTEMFRAEADASQATSDWRDAQLTLAGLIGREADMDALTTTSDWPDPALGSAEPAIEVADRRPDVQAAQARVEAARRALDAAHALKHPDVTVGVQYEHAGGDLGVGNSVGLGLSVPLPVLNRYDGEVDAASTALVQAEALERKARAVAAAEISRARTEVAEATARRQLIVESQLPAAQKAADVAEFAYAHGAIALLDLLDARRSLQAVELGAIDARNNEAAAIAALRSAETTGDQ